MSSSIAVSHLTKSFSGKKVLDDISLEIAPGELFFLLGPSGCGKTTLLRTLAGLHDPDSGSVLLAGEDITRLPPHRRDMPMVFQSYALWPHLTLFKNVAFGLEMRRVPTAEIRARVMEALDLVRLADRAESRPNELSGGQQQRVALARALVIRPQCLLLDEPLSNLDAKLRIEMRTEIRRICKQAGLTAVYVTHDQKEALSVADRLAILDRGHILQIGTPFEVYTRPATSFVANFIGETSFLRGTLRAVDADAFTVDTPIGPVQTARDPSMSAPPLSTPVILSIRPEAVQLHATLPPGTPNTFDAFLHGTVYLGETAQHDVEIPAATPSSPAVALKALEIRPRHLALDAARTPVRLHISPSDIRLLLS